MKKFFLKKKQGIGTVFVAAMLFAFGLVFLFYVDKKNTISEMKVKCEDALVSSTLAGALIDVEEYGKDGDIIVPNYSECYQNFKSCLDTNLKLDGNGNSEYTTFFASPIEVTDFIIYNVDKSTGKITVLQGDGNSLISQYETNLGSTYAPDGTYIENTSIYSKIKFEAKYSNLRTIQADKECCVDITGR